MSVRYDAYLELHKNSVRKGFEWIRENLPELLIGEHDYEWQICYNHDYSKTKPSEYYAYDEYFYGTRTDAVIKAFQEAWLAHNHANQHHWQHWILINDDPNEGEVILDMPYNYILEMICDWWSFSWVKENLYEIFNWYDEHKDYMKLSDKTRETVEDILSKIRGKLDEQQVKVIDNTDKTY